MRTLNILLLSATFLSILQPSPLLSMEPETEKPKNPRTKQAELSLEAKAAIHTGVYAATHPDEVVNAGIALVTVGSSMYNLVSHGVQYGRDWYNGKLPSIIESAKKQAASTNLPIEAMVEFLPSCMPITLDSESGIQYLHDADVLQTWFPAFPTHADFSYKAAIWHMSSEDQLKFTAFAKLGLNRGAKIENSTTPTLVKVLSPTDAEYSFDYKFWSWWESKEEKITIRVHATQVPESCFEVHTLDKFKQKIFALKRETITRINTVPLNDQWSLAIRNIFEEASTAWNQMYYQTLEEEKAAEAKKIAEANAAEEKRKRDEEIAEANRIAAAKAAEEKAKNAGNGWFGGYSLPSISILPPISIPSWPFSSTPTQPAAQHQQDDTGNSTPQPSDPSIGDDIPKTRPTWTEDNSPVMPVVSIPQEENPTTPLPIPNWRPGGPGDPRTNTTQPPVGDSNAQQTQPVQPRRALPAIPPQDSSPQNSDGIQKVKSTGRQNFSAQKSSQESIYSRQFNQSAKAVMPQDLGELGEKLQKAKEKAEATNKESPSS